MSSLYKTCDNEKLASAIVGGVTVLLAMETKHLLGSDDLNFVQKVACVMLAGTVMVYLALKLQNCETYVESAVMSSLMGVGGYGCIRYYLKNFDAFTGLRDKMQAERKQIEMEVKRALKSPAPPSKPVPLPSSDKPTPPPSSKS